MQNILPILRPARQKLTKTPVTIIVALKCKDGVVVGSDGQTSYSNSTRKVPDARKVSIVQIGDSNVIFAQSGNADMGNRAFEFISEHAKDATNDAPRSAADLIELGLHGVRQKLRETHQTICHSAEDFKNLFNDFDCSLLCVSMLNGKPHIYSGSLYHGMAIKEVKDYALLGCGSSIGELLLCELPIADMDWKEAVATAVYVIEKAKRFDSACGGQTYLATLKYDGSAICSDGEESRTLISQFTRAFEDEDRNEKDSWKNKMMEMVKRVAEKRTTQSRSPIGPESKT